MDPRKKNPLDIFNNTSAAMGGDPNLKLTRPGKPAAVPAQQVVAPTASRQAGGIRFQPGADLRRGNGVQFRDVGAPATVYRDVSANDIGKKIGQGYESLKPLADDAYNNTVGAVVNSVGGGARNLVRGFNGQNSINEPIIKPVGSTPTAPQKTAPANVAPAIAPPTAAPPALAPPIVSRPSGVAPGSVAASVDAQGRPTYDNSSIAKLNERNGIAGTVAADQPFTRANLNAATAPAFDGRQLAQNAAADQRGVAGQVRNDANRAINPNSSEGELLRRIEIAGGGFKGSPSTRRAVMGALAGQLDAGNKASSDYQNGANEAFSRGQSGDISSGLQQQQTRGQAVLQDIQQTGNERLERLKNENQGSNVTGADGNSYFVRGSSASAINTQDGKPLKSQQTEALSKKDIGALLSDQLKGLDALNDPDGSQRASINSRIDQLIGGGKPTNAPEVGAERGGYRFKGGDPADKANWEKV